MLTAVVKQTDMIDLAIGHRTQKSALAPSQKIRKMLFSEAVRNSLEH
ncbi:hypothetical protein [Kamptonema sp. PCC 6506]|nr:hypothetical protein [Kamptonema sp. PCC 6506]CBN57588.1 hypothetical protein OSCI_3470016 [Kamptonema sp. PCC 6506]